MTEGGTKSHFPNFFLKEIFCEHTHTPNIWNELSKSAQSPTLKHTSHVAVLGVFTTCFI